MSERRLSGRKKMVELAVVLTATAMFVVVCGVVPAAADPPYVPQGPFVTPAAGSGLPTPAQVTGKEYSTHTPGVYGSGDTDHWNVLDPEQVQNWDGAGGTYDGWDYSGSRINSYPSDTMDREVDALANMEDALFNEVIADTAHLLFSVTNNGNILYERRIVGGGGIWATAAQINAAHPPQDIDGLEVWGPEPPYLYDPPYSPFIGDANRYSLESTSQNGIPDPLGVSVWDVSGGGAAVALWSTSEIAQIVNLVTGKYVSASQINVDGLMTWEENEILFSIDPVPSQQIDGGEIFVGTRQGPGGPVGGGFLLHGGHLWNTAFNVMQTFGVNSENVNALEAVSMIPEPATLVLVGLALLGLAGLRRRG